jgi:hypothetical protein
VNANSSITDLLAAPLCPDGTIEWLAEQLLDTIAAQQPGNAGEVQEYVLDACALTDRQARRLLRPLLACLATKSEAENSTTVNLFGGQLCFKRSGPAGPVWITGQFDNRPGVVRVDLQRSDSVPESHKPTTAPSSSGLPDDRGLSLPRAL